MKKLTVISIIAHAMAMTLHGSMSEETKRILEEEVDRAPPEMVAIHKDVASRIGSCLDKDYKLRTCLHRIASKSSIYGNYILNYQFYINP